MPQEPRQLKQLRFFCIRFVLCTIVTDLAVLLVLIVAQLADEPGALFHLAFHNIRGDAFLS